MRGQTIAADPSMDARRWRMLAMVCAGVFLVMSTWFSGTAITLELAKVHDVPGGRFTALTYAVQLGFAVGAAGIGALNLADRLAPRHIIAAAAALAAITNLALLLHSGPQLVIAARVATGVMLAGVYPPALKLVSSWFQSDRGLALGAVVAALTLGSALPYLLRTMMADVDWRLVIWLSTLGGLIGAALIGYYGESGPHLGAPQPFQISRIGGVIANRAWLLVTAGYVGHMWELYAMWGGFLSYARAAIEHHGLALEVRPSLVTFFVLAFGVAGAIGGGLLADRIGRIGTVVMMMLVSGACSVAIGFTFSGPLWLFLAVAMIWGCSVIGDSAQFSALTTEVCKPEEVGTALTLQLGIGFAVTILSIWLTTQIASVIGWRWSFLVLTPGPIIGILASLRLTTLPRPTQLARAPRTFPGSV